MILKAFTASDIRFEPKLLPTIYSPFELVDGEDFQNGEIFPYYFPVRIPEYQWQGTEPEFRRRKKIHTYEDKYAAERELEKKIDAQLNLSPKLIAEAGKENGTFFGTGDN